jgi:hypothetical protein
MNQELKTKWLAALRSGGYKQGRQKLRIGKGENTRMCCLGVLADIIDPDAWGRNNHWLHEGDVRDQLDLSTLNRVEIRSIVQSRLINFNDRDKKSFTEIADYIEAHL